MSSEPLFDEKEWRKCIPELVGRMQRFLEPYRTPVFEDFGTYGDGWGSGAYLQLGSRIFILTNEHVAAAREQGRKLTYRFAGQDELRLVVGHHLSRILPFDLALLPVNEDEWRQPTHYSRAITVDQIAWAHAPLVGEVFTFTGFAGDNVDFHFGQLTSRGTCYSALEVPLSSDDSRFSTRFHFGLDYKPDLASSVSSKEILPLPPGLSGSVVWNTCFAEAKARGIEWTPELAKVTGVVWGWPSNNGLLVATRAEYLRGFLLDAM